MYMTMDCLMMDAMARTIANKSASMLTPLSISEVSGWLCPKTELLEELSRILVRINAEIMASKPIRSRRTRRVEPVPSNSDNSMPKQLSFIQSDFQEQSQLQAGPIVPARTKQINFRVAKTAADFPSSKE